MKKILALVLILSLVLSAVPFCGYAATETNKLSNGTFESWKSTTLPSYWSLSNANVSSCSQDKTYKMRGTYGARITDTSTTLSGGIKSDSFTVSEGAIYKLVAYVYVHSGQMSFFIRFSDSNGTAISGKDITVVAKKIGEWEMLNITGLAPEGAATAQLWIHSYNEGTGSVTVDDVNVYRYGFEPPTQVGAVNSSIIAPNGNTLKYDTYDSKGNKLSDFSYAGFYAGKYEIPDSEYLTPGKYVEIEPATYTEEEIEDGTAATADTKRINDAITDMANSLTKKQMGVVKLKPGTFYISTTSVRLKSNVVLSGSGQGPTGTILYAGGERPIVYDKDGNITYDDEGNIKRSNFIVIRGYLNTNAFKTGAAVNISDDYVKSGSKTFSVEDASSFKVGDLIRIHHPSTKEWDELMGTSTLTYTDDNGKTTETKWEGKVDMDTERTITAIDGNKITVDFPLFVHLDNKIAQCTVCTIDDSIRLVNAGVENLRIVSDFDPNIVKNGNFVDENHANYGIYFQNAKNCYAQDVTFKHIMYSAVTCGAYTKQITIRGCTSIEPVSIIDGGRRYIFACSKNSQQILITGCYSHAGRHDFETSYTATGPIAFVDNVADASLAASETHGTWSTGVLYDNLLHIGNSTNGFIASTNRGVYGTSTSQGWSGAGVVIWNSLASVIVANKPLGGYQNFLVGTWGNYTDSLASDMKAHNIRVYKTLYKTDYQSEATDANFATAAGTSFAGDVYKESATTPVEPRSLFKAQLSERLKGNYKYGKPNAPTIVSPSPDDTYNNTNVFIRGFYQKGATAVNVYIDNTQYKASLNTSNNTFFLKTELPAGTHKIYVTQVINEIEGNKSPDRFVIIKSKGKYSIEQSSNYSISTLSLIRNDTRMSFDEYVESLITDELPETLEDNVITYSGDASKSSPLIIKNHFNASQHIKSEFRALATRVGSLKGYTIKEYGMTVAGNNKTYRISDAAAKVEGKTALSSDSGYGILFHNLLEERDYYITPYVIYNETSENINHEVYGKTQIIRKGAENTVSERGKVILYESFENGLEKNDWLYAGDKTMSTITDEDSYAGSHSLLAVDQLESTSSGVSTYLPGTVGKTYTLDAFMKTNKSNMSVYLRFCDSNKKKISQVSAKPSSNNEWMNTICSAVAPENTVYVQIILTGVSTGLGDAYFDDIAVFESME